jgi:hypothetical protein
MRLRAAFALPLLPALLATGCGADDPSSVQSQPPTNAAAAVGPGWRQLPDAPLSGRTGASVVGVGDRAYVFGGWEFLCPPGADCDTPTEPPFADGAVVDLATGEWSPMSEAPSGLVHAPAAALGERIYVVASCERVDRPDSHCLLAYETTSDEWAELGPLPRNAGTLLTPTDHGLLALAGTEENGEVHDALYAPATGTWQVLPDDPMPASFDRFAVADGDRVLVFGSPIVAPDEESGVKLGAAYDLVDGTWTRLPPAPGPGYQVWGAGDRAYLNPHYGDDGGGVLDLVTDTWSPFPEWPDPQGEPDLAGIVSVDGATYENPEGWVLDVREDDWLRVPARGGEAYDESIGAAGQALVVFGGQEWSGGGGALLSATWVWEPPG